MDEWIERPKLFRSYWPRITHIKCGECETHWDRPQFASHNAYFPPPALNEEQVAITRAYCPRCGVLMPELPDLIHAGLATESVVAHKPFIGTVSGVREFLADSRNSGIHLWEYVVSHSHLTLKIDSKRDATYAFVRCVLTRSVQLPSLSWKGCLSLQPTEDKDYWQLVDEEANTRIVCAMIGVFHQLTFLE